jgi:hypothetical protein
VECLMVNGQSGTALNCWLFEVSFLYPTERDWHTPNNDILKVNWCVWVLCSFRVCLCGFIPT